MNTRLTALLGGLAVAAVIIGSPASRAQGFQINPFSQYYENVARAAKQNDAGQVRSLIANGGYPDQADDQGRTAMHYGAISGNLQIIAILIKGGAKLDPKERLGNTPLHLAADVNQVEAVKLLLDVGAAVDPENKIAASRGDIDIVQALLAKGASVTKTDYTGRDAAGWAAESRRPAVVQAIKRAQSAKKS